MLAPLDRETYAWQLDLPYFDEAAQEKLRSPRRSSRARRVGWSARLWPPPQASGSSRWPTRALRKDDMNRRPHEVGRLRTPRVQSAAKTLAAFNPNVKVETADANFSEDNAAEPGSAPTSSFPAPSRNASS